MINAAEYIESGILEMYVLGCTTKEEATEVERMAALHDEVREELDAISAAMEQYAKANAVEPDPTVRPFIMATIDYTERLKRGEIIVNPPSVTLDSKVEDYAYWLDRKDLQLNEPLIDFHAHLIGHTPEVTTAIVWLKYGAPPETHTRELEKFLIVEGTCDITVGSDVHKMKPGEVLIIPLHVTHHVKVTSDYPCKIILQRMAA
jgi:mannose-6-phosphate isomerase-like protein (cupin superfamily)